MINGPAIGLAGAARPAKPVKAEAVSNLTDTSFVKIGGKSQMTDWQTCESGAGGVFVPADTALGYSVSAKFETCMRGKGYVPESEAIAQFEQSAAL